MTVHANLTETGWGFAQFHVPTEHCGISSRPSHPVFSRISFSIILYRRLCSPSPDVPVLIVLFTLRSIPCSVDVCIEVVLLSPSTQISTEQDHVRSYPNGTDTERIAERRSENIGISAERTASTWYVLNTVIQRDLLHQQLKLKSVVTALNTVPASVFTETT
jgi:hypothetical protein